MKVGRRGFAVRREAVTVIPARPRRLSPPGLPGVAVILLCVAALLAGCKEEKNTYVPPPPPQVGVAKPLHQSVTPYLEATGTTVAFNQVNLEARIQGFLTAIDYVDGAAVKQGDTLFVIEPAPYQAALQQAQATMQATQAQLVQAEAEFKRQATLLAQNVSAQNTYDQALAKRDSTRANLLEQPGRRDPGGDQLRLHPRHRAVRRDRDQPSAIGRRTGRLWRAHQACHHRPARSDLRHLQRQRAGRGAHPAGGGEARPDAGRHRQDPDRGRAGDRAGLSA